jgi:hypothetical protein
LNSCSKDAFVRLKEGHFISRKKRRQKNEKRQKESLINGIRNIRLNTKQLGKKNSG